MLIIKIPEIELYDDNKKEFTTIEEHVLKFEHSLLSISKWEAKYCKPFLSANRTFEETIDYFKCMLITQNVDTMYFNFLPNKVIKELIDYIEAPNTATTFSNNGERSGSPQKTIITSELIYYWMIVHQIPIECEKWHLNRLLTLIRVCNAKNGNQKKMSKSEIYSKNRALNAARRAKSQSKG